VTLNKAAKRVGLGMKMMAGLGGVGLLPKVDALAGEPAKADEELEAAKAEEAVEAAG
jgi:hypothetical protein